MDDHEEPDLPPETKPCGGRCNRCLKARDAARRNDERVIFREPTAADLQAA